MELPQRLMSGKKTHSHQSRILQMSIWGPRDLEASVLVRETLPRAQGHPRGPGTMTVYKTRQKTQSQGERGRVIDEKGKKKEKIELA